MELLNDIFPIIIYFLVAVLLFVIIILITKLISTVEKVNILLDDVEGKSQKLNGLFDAIEKVGDTIKSANSKVSGLVAKLVTTVFKQKRKNKKSNKEEVEDDE
ncbi:MAG: hypothetical protein IKO78_05555 [Bacilli bacterium]|nr:hypothetical protein [Bacilli bacterium]